MIACLSCRAENEDSADNCLHCGKGLFVLTLGAVLNGRYEIVGSLGKGGMGMVYKALDRELEEAVAIKILRSENAAAADLVKRFRAEIKLARRVSHPNVCRIHDYGKEGHLAYIVMEFIEGIDIKRTIREKGPLGLDEAFDVAIGVSEALQAIHDVGIVHRDLKTPNIMRDARGLVRLMDFGIAKMFDAESAAAMTATGQIVGTPEYMSPEQARAQKVDARSDIYSLGVVVFELFTGDVPFRGDTPLATLFKHIQDAPPLDGAPASRIPPPVRTLLRKALAKNKEDRPATARELATALRAIRTTSSPSPLPRGIDTPILTAHLPELALLDEPTPVPTPVPGEIRTVTLQGHLGRPEEGSGSRTRAARRSAPAPFQAAAPSRSSRTTLAPSRHKGEYALWIGALTAATIVAGLLYLQRASGSAPLPPAPNEIGTAGDDTSTSIPPTLSVRVGEEPTQTAPSQSEPPVSGSRSTVPEGPRAKQDAGVGIGERGGRRPQRPDPPPTTVMAARQPLPSPEAHAPVSVPSPTPTTLTAASPAPLSQEITEAGHRLTADAADAVARLQVGVKPWAEVFLGERSLGISPISPLSVAAGSHTLRFVHPDYQPVLRKVTIRPGETIRLQVDFSIVGVPK